MRIRPTPSPRAVALALTLIPAIAASPPAAAGAQTTSTAAAPTEPGTVMEKALESRVKGGEDASVVVFEIADFQCPYCGQFARTVARELDAAYVETGKVQWVFVNLPLHTHPLAWLAAEAALCAGVAGDRFWPMHDRLFEEQQAWSGLTDPTARFAGYAESLGVPGEAYRTCVDRDQVATLILQDVGSVVGARIDGTPTFIIMKDGQVIQRLVGVHPFEDWKKVLDEALK